jgi:hypothetical protein
MNTEAVNPIIKKARWIAVKLCNAGHSVLSPSEKIFISQLSYRAAVQNDHTARRLVSQLQAAHLEYQFKLS